MTKLGKLESAIKIYHDILREIIQQNLPREFSTNYKIPSVNALSSIHYNALGKDLQSFPIGQLFYVGTEKSMAKDHGIEFYGESNGKGKYFYFFDIEQQARRLDDMILSGNATLEVNAFDIGKRRVDLVHARTAKSPFLIGQLHPAYKIRKPMPSFLTKF